jgi:hypothetical protein
MCALCPKVRDGGTARFKTYEDSIAHNSKATLAVTTGCPDYRRPDSAKTALVRAEPLLRASSTIEFWLESGTEILRIYYDGAFPLENRPTQNC